MKLEKGPAKDVNVAHFFCRRFDVCQTTSKSPEVIKVVVANHRVTIIMTAPPGRATPPNIKIRLGITNVIKGLK